MHLISFLNYMKMFNIIPDLELIEVQYCIFLYSSLIKLNIYKSYLKFKNYIE